MNSKILVTGFQPFGTESVNPSGLLLDILAPEFSAQIETLLLPVTYKGSVQVLKDHWTRQGPYRGLLMLGQAARRKTVCLERVALNWSETTYADEDGVRLSPGPLVARAQNAYIADFFPNAWKDLLCSEGPTELSFSAGTYVCNHLYFTAFNDICAPGTPLLFVHVPYLPEQIVNKPDQPSLPLDIQAKVIRRLIQLMDELLPQAC